MITAGKLPQTGDVYCQLSGTHWSAFQIIHEDHQESALTIMELDWYSERKMTSADLEPIVPLKMNRFRMEDELAITLVGFENILQTELPEDRFQFIGNKPLPDGMEVTAMPFSTNITWQGLQGEAMGLSAEWPGSNAAIEKWWSDFPEADRNNYKRCYQRNQDISLFGQTLNSRDADIFIPDNAVHDWHVLDDFGCLTSLECEGRQDGLMEYLQQRSLIESVNWKNCAHDKIDARNPNITWLHRISIGGTQLKELMLDAGMKSVDLHGKLHPELTIRHSDAGKDLDITFWNNLVNGIVPDFILPQLNGLNIYAPQIDAASIVAAYPNLESLDLRGELGIIKNIAALGKLKGLKKLMLFELFGYTADEFPGKSAWSKLEYIYIQTYPAELTQKLKSEFADCPSYTVRMPKKAEWIAENLDNPFRDWEGREIASGKIKKALAAYKKANAEIAKLKKPVAKTCLSPVLEAFTDSMNKIADVIDTAEREEVYAIYQGLLEKAGIMAEKAAYNQLFETWRDF